VVAMVKPQVCSRLYAAIYYVLIQLLLSPSPLIGVEARWSDWRRAGRPVTRRLRRVKSLWALADRSICLL